MPTNQRGTLHQKQAHTQKRIIRTNLTENSDTLVYYLCCVVLFAFALISDGLSVDVEDTVCQPANVTVLIFVRFKTNYVCVQAVVLAGFECQ